MLNEECLLNVFYRFIINTYIFYVISASGYGKALISSTLEIIFIPSFGPKYVLSEFATF